MQGRRNGKYLYSDELPVMQGGPRIVEGLNGRSAKKRTNNETGENFGDFRNNLQSLHHLNKRRITPENQVNSDMIFVSQEPGSTLEEMDGKYFYDDSAGAGQIVYVMGDGIDPGHTVCIVVVYYFNNILTIKFRNLQAIRTRISHYCILGHSTFQDLRLALMGFVSYSIYFFASKPITG